MLNAMNFCKEQTKIAGSQFRTKNKQNRNDHAVFCPKKNFFQLDICFQYFGTGSSVKINEKKKKHTHTKKTTYQRQLLQKIWHCLVRGRWIILSPVGRFCIFFTENVRKIALEHRYYKSIANSLYRPKFQRQPC